ncbi:MAG TPA: protein kinase [Anaerolineaceae bacterium]
MDLIGQTIDQNNRYRIVSLLGEGGMGGVYKGFDQTLQREVAIKTLHTRFAAQEDFRERFLQEARAAARLSHPAIVQVYDYGEKGSLLYIVMELIPGKDLRRLLTNLQKSGGNILLDEAVKLVQQICYAIDYTHQKGVLHRDLKPDNIMLKPIPSLGLPYQPVLTDLGLAKLLEGGIETQTGLIMGTPAYMSPEQVLGDPTSARSDIYSLGVLAYELTAGRLPYPLRTLTDAVRFHAGKTPEMKLTFPPEIPTELEKVIRQAMEHEPAARFSSAAALAEAFNRALEFLPSSQGQRTILGREIGVAEEPPKKKRVIDVTETDEPLPSAHSPDTLEITGKERTTRQIPITKTPLRFGRDPECEIVLDDAKVSRLHAVLDYSEGAYRLTDQHSTNGTFMGEQRLLPDIPQVWSAGKVARIAGFELRLNQQGGKPTYSDDTGSDNFSQQGKPPPTQARITLDKSELAVEPGGSVVMKSIVINQGVLVDHFRISLQGVPEDWVSISGGEVQLMPAEQGEALLVIAPPRQPASRAGPYALTVAVSSRVSPQPLAEAKAALKIAPFYQFNLNLRPQKHSAPLEGSFTVELSNLGNAELHINLKAQDPEDACQYTFTPNPVVVPPGQDRLAALKVQSRMGGIMAANRSYPFLITATPSEAPTLIQQGRGEWEQAAPAFEVSLRPQKQRSVWQGAFSFTLRNLSNASLALALEGRDDQEACRFTFDPPELTLAPGEERTSALKVQAQAPLLGSQTRTYNIEAVAKLKGAGSVARLAQGAWEQVPAAVTLSLTPARQSSKVESIYRLEVNNHSEGEVSLALEAATQDAEVLCSLTPDKVTLPAGVECHVELKVTARKPNKGVTPRVVALHVLARIAENTRPVAEARGEWLQDAAPAPTGGTPLDKQVASVSKPSTLPEPVEVPRGGGCLVGMLKFIAGVLITLICLLVLNFFFVILQMNPEVAFPILIILGIIGIAISLTVGIAGSAKG